MINSLIKNIRESRNLTKKQIYENNFSSYYYDRIENNCSYATIYDLKVVTKKLNITLEEFIYLYTNEYSFQKNQLNSVHKKENDKKYHQYDITNSLYIAVKHLRNNDFDSAKKEFFKVWDTINSYDEFLASDLFLLSHCFILFPIENNNLYIQLLEKQFPFWRRYNNFIETEVSFYLNIGRYLLEHDSCYKKIFSFYEKAYNLSKEYSLGLLTGVSSLRLGYLTKNNDFIQDGKNLLKLFDLNQLEIELSDLNEIYR